MAFRSLFLYALCCLAAVEAITVYDQVPLGHQTSSAAAATSTGTDAAATPTSTEAYSGLAAYDPTTLTPPALPSPLPATQFPIVLMPAANQVNGLSIRIPSSFFGFSIEMSVATQMRKSLPLYSQRSCKAPSARESPCASCLLLSLDSVY